jgi:putative pyoverdin transport system ATP-binding/permease protein
MSLLNLIKEEAAETTRTLVVTASLAGLANVLVIAQVQQVAQDPKEAGVRSFAFFALAVLLYIVCARRTYHRTTFLVESALNRIKLNIVSKVGKMDFRGLERMGTAEINDRLTENATVISSSAGMLANLLQSLCIVVFSVGYIAWLSAPAFALVCLVTGLGMSLYVSKKHEIDAFLREAGLVRLQFLDRLTDLLRGFKELKFSARRREDVEGDIQKSAVALSDVTMKANHLFDDNLILATCILFALLGSVVFALPHRVSIDTSQLAELVAAVTFIWGPLGGVAAGFPAYMRSNGALARIRELESKLDAAAEEVAFEAAQDPWQGRFQQLTAKGISYEYDAPKGASRFHVGPLDFTLKAGEVVFIVGGNGSGKTTLLRVLTGLYPSSTGSLLLDGIPVQADNVAAYREKISAIFSDFHLFSKLYGLLGVEDATVQALLAQMQLHDKTAFKGGRFTNRDLSTGQRKRLALIVTLLEDRPVYVFDEWAADQDPEFRSYFYDELLPDLKRRGKAVIAVSHDDRYFRCADRVITMEYGQIRSDERGAVGGSSSSSVVPGP